MNKSECLSKILEIIQEFALNEGGNDETKAHEHAMNLISALYHSAIMTHLGDGLNEESLRKLIQAHAEICVKHINCILTPLKIAKDVSSEKSHF